MIPNLSGHQFESPLSPKASRFLTQMNECPPSYRDGSIQNIHHLVHRQPQNHIMKRSTGVAEDGKPPHYPRNQQNRGVNLNKNGVASFGSNSNVNNNNNNNVHLQPSNTNRIQRKQSLQLSMSPRASTGSVIQGENKDVHEKIQALAKIVRENQKKLTNLQKNFVVLENNFNFSSLSSSTNDKTTQFSKTNEQTLRMQLEIMQIKDKINKNPLLSNIQSTIIEKLKQFCPKKNDFVTDHIILKQKKRQYEQIQQIRRQIQMMKHQVDSKINRTQQSLNSSIANINAEITIISKQISTFSSEKRRQSKSTSKSTNLLNFVQYLKINQQQPKFSQHQVKQIVFKIGQFSYFIDEDGFLLDNQKYYLVDNQNTQIRIQQDVLKKIKQLGLLS